MDHPPRLADGSPIDAPPSGDVDSPSFLLRLLGSIPAPSPGSPAPRSIPLEAGAILGDFRLVRQLGSGGMGQVWEAEELSLDSRLVALKFVRPDRISPKTLERFTQEAKVGGRLSHPGIVGVHGFGETDGVHWINQELVTGGWTLRHLLDEAHQGEGLPKEYYQSMAELVLLVADALQAAHDLGVIHRDVKPQNILIGSDGRPRLTDFGLARVSGEPGLSESGQQLGTYHYMSPEQVLARSDIDHRTDVFSLGVVLYEVLALQRPFEGDSATQITQRILQSDPPDLRKLRSRLPQDLAAIANKALEKRPEARYPSAAAMAADLRAYLAHEPITAKPPGAARRAAKWVRRNPVVSAAGGVGAVALAAISVLLLQFVDRSNQLATERDRLEDVTTFQAGLLGGLDPSSFGTELRLGLFQDFDQQMHLLGHPPEEVEAALADLRPKLATVNFTNLGVKALRQQVLEPALELAAERFADDATTRGRIQLSLGKTESSLGEQLAAVTTLGQAHEGLLADLGPSHPLTLEAAVARIEAMMALAQIEEAFGFCREVIESLDDGHDPLDADAYELFSAEGLLLCHLNRSDEGLPMVQALADRAERELGLQDDRTQALLLRLALCLEGANRVEDAREVYKLLVQQARGLDRKALHSVADNHRRIAQTLLAQGEVEPALLTIDEALAALEEAHGDHCPHVPGLMETRSRALERLGRMDELLATRESIYEVLREINGDYNTETNGARLQLGWLLSERGELLRAEVLLEEGLAIEPLLGGANSLQATSYELAYASLLMDLDRPAEALPLLEHAVQVLDRPDRGATMSINSVRFLMIACLELLGEEERAREVQLTILNDADGLEELANEGDPRVILEMAWAAELLERYDLAEDYYREALGTYESHGKPSDENAMETRYRLSGTLMELGREEDAIRLLEESVALRGPRPHGDVELYSLHVTLLADAYLAMDQTDEAVALLERELQLGQGHYGAELVQPILYTLGHELSAAGDLDRAFELLERELTLCRELRVPADELAISLFELGMLYAQEGQTERAFELMEEELALSRELYGDTDPETRGSLYQLGWLYLEAGDAGRGLGLLQEELEACIVAEGAGADDTLTSALELGAWLHEDGRLHEAAAILEPAGHAAVTGAGDGLRNQTIDQVLATLDALAGLEPEGDWAVRAQNLRAEREPRPKSR